jgi:hypothetical protein
MDSGLAAARAPECNSSIPDEIPAGPALTIGGAAGAP